MSKTRNTNYDLDFKISSAKLAVESESVSQTARNLGVKPSTMHGWVKQYVKTEEEISKPTLPEAKLQAELQQLRKEVSRLRQERDILKKATAYFASEIL
jgi:transposase